MDYQKEKIDSVTIAGDIKIFGYSGEYIFEKIKSTGEFYEQRLLDKWLTGYSGIKTIYDIGANLGNHTLYFATKTKAHIYAFEPMPMNFSLLEKNVNDNKFNDRVTLYNVALGDTQGIAHMGIAQEKNNGSATILSLGNEETTEVRIDVLDYMRLPKPDFVKIDVEGFELFVLKGMKNILVSSSPILWIEVKNEKAKEVYDFLYDIGYKFFDCDLKNDNNIVFSKNVDSDYANIFYTLLKIGEEKRALWWDARKQQSKYEYEQKKAQELKSKLQEVSVKYEKELEKVNELTKQILSLNDYNKRIENELLNIQIKYQELSQQAERMQKDLDMFNNSRMISFMRFWVWKVPTTIRRFIRKKVDEFGHLLYVKLMPYPRLRNICSSINSKLKIYKNPQEIIATEQSRAGEKHHTIKNKTMNIIKSPREMNVAMIVDEFTYNSFRYECNAFPLEPQNWKEVFKKNDIDLFFCESAWSGTDSIHRPWKGKIYSSIRFPEENRGILLEILDYCHEKGIPTAFWNKEDPAHYDDKIHNFVDTAIKFDHIFTTSIECVERYKKDYGHKSVHLLMFASQPKLFNPIEKYNRTDEIIFAGSWYKQHKNRCKEMSQIFDAILDSQYPLKIYNRQSDNPDPNHEFPSKYLPYVHPRLPHDQLDIAYKGSKYALNINTVTESETMFARRVFELISCNTLIISNYSKGMQLLFGNNIIFTEGREAMDLSNADEKRERCLNLVLQQHTYKKRMEQILNDMGIPFLYYNPQVIIIYKVIDFDTANRCVAHYYKIDWKNKKCLLMVNDNCSPEVLQEICIKFSCDGISVISEHYHRFYDNYEIKDFENKYFILADDKLDIEFISKAMTHYQYLDQQTPICQSNKKYVFGDIDTAVNVLWPAVQFKKVFYETKDPSKGFSNVYFI